jgi:hypothetical protein
MKIEEFAKHRNDCGLAITQWMAGHLERYKDMSLSMAALCNAYCDIMAKIKEESQDKERVCINQLLGLTVDQLTELRRGDGYQRTDGAN